MRPGTIIPDPGYPSGDVALVYRAVLDVLYYPPDKKPRLVILHDLAESRERTCYKTPCPFIPAHKSRIDPATLWDFNRAVLTRRQIRPSFTYRLPLVVLTDHMRQTLYSIGVSHPNRELYKIEPPFWIGFLQAYPGAWGLAELTQVGFNPARNQAILQVRHRCGGYCQSIEIMFLENLKGVWRVVERITEAQSSPTVDYEHKDLRHRGVGARMPSEERAEWVADSLRKTLLPRSIRGIVTDSATGARIAFIPMLVASADAPWSAREYFSSDSLGRYRVANPPVGWVGILVHCPKSSSRLGELAGYASFMVRSEQDTTVNVSINLNRCQDSLESDLVSLPRVLKSLPAPLLDSADAVAAQAATYPSMEEAAIYTTVLNGMGGPSPGQVTLVANKTRTFCFGSDCDDRYIRRIRSVPEVILSTLDDFLMVRKKRISLRPDFTAQSELVSSHATRSDVALIGERAIDHLQAETNFSDSAHLASGKGYDLGYWETIQLAHPSVRQIVAFSPIAFSPRRRQALLQATRTDVNGLRETMFLLNYEKGEWRIARLF